MKRILTFCGAVPAAFVCFSSLAADAPPADKPTPKVGDVLEYADKYYAVSCKRWVIQDTNKNGNVVSQCGDYTAYIAADGNLVKIEDKNGKPLTEFKPQAYALAFPLQVGKKWEGKNIGFSAIDGYTWEDEAKCEVTGFETVKVAAGEFPAYKVDCKDSWQVGSFSGTDASTRWYSPKANAIVKVSSPGRDKWEMELTGFSSK
jgi:hypothetical protein